jgi:hypothetical protein
MDEAEAPKAEPMEPELIAPNADEPAQLNKGKVEALPPHEEEPEKFEEPEILDAEVEDDGGLKPPPEIDAWDIDD